MLFGASALILFSLKDRTPAAVWQTAVGVLSWKEEVLDDLVKNVKRQAGSRAALTACLFTPGMEGDFANEELMKISCANEEESTRDQRYQNTKAIILRCSGRHNGK